MADLDDIHAAQPVRIIGADSNGNETYPADVNSSGELKVAGSFSADIQTEMESSFYPDPSSWATGETSGLRSDSDRNLRIRGSVTNDAGSFRDDFSGTSLETALTGTVTVTNGSVDVTGSGTAFLTEIIERQYIRLNTEDPLNVTRIAEVIDDTHLILAEGYLGTSGTGSAKIVNWRYTSDSGATVAVADSLITLGSGTTSGAFAYIQKYADYGPLSAYFDMEISHRRANQTILCGFVDQIRNATLGPQAIVVFEGTNTSKLIFRTASSTDPTDIEETEINYAATGSLDCRIDLTAQSATLSIEGEVVARHTDHIPGPYDVMRFAAKIENTDTVAGNTDLILNVVGVANFDTVTPNNPMVGNPQSVKLVESGAAGAVMQSSFYPDPTNWSSGEEVPLIVDSKGSLQSRSAVFTDEGSLRDDFLGSSLVTSLTGTAYFTNGSNVINGNGTLFTSEVKDLSWIKLTGHADSVYAKVIDVISNTEILLDTAYTGATGNGTAENAYWKPSTNGGASIAVANSIVTLSSSTASGNYAKIKREVDYGPLSGAFTFNLSQRIANQKTIIGFVDDITSPSIQACLVFEGTTTTTLKFITSTASDANNTQETIVVLTAGSTADTLIYAIDVTPSTCTLAINGIIKAVHETHIPGPYDIMEAAASIENTGVAGSNTNLNIHTIFVNNINVVQIANIFPGQPLKVQAVGAPNIYQQNVVDGEVTIAASSLVPVRDTTYTEQSSNARRSVKSSSANDAAAGTGARTIKIIYYDAAYTGPYTETITLTGTTYVNTVASDICFIESIEVLTAGSGGVAAGTISLYTTTGGTGTVIWSIGTGKLSTFSCHHYVGTGRTCYISSIVYGTTGTVAGNGGKFYLRSKRLNVSDDVNKQITNSFTVPGAQAPNYVPFEQNITVTGPALVSGWVTPTGTATYNSNLSFNYYEI